MDSAIIEWYPSEMATRGWRNGAMVGWALQLVGCGGGSESEATHPPQPSAPGSIVAASSTAPDASASPPPKSAPNAELGEVVTTEATPDRLGSEAKPLIYHVGDNDPLGVAIRLVRNDDVGDPRGFGHPDAYVSELTVTITDASGSTRRTASLAKQPTVPRWFWPDRTMFLDIDHSTARPRSPARPEQPWNEGPLRWKEGPIELSVEGVVLGEGGVRHTFTAGPVPYVRGGSYPSRQSLLDNAHAKTVGFPKPGEGAGAPMVEAGFVDGIALQLSDDRFVVRFAQPRGFSFDLTSILLDSGANVVEVEDKIVDTCVATGMTLDAPSGPVPVERLEVGDEVWGYDAERGTIATRVTSVIAYPMQPTVWVDGRLHVSPSHPVWQDGAFVAASELRIGGALRSPEGIAPPLGSLVPGEPTTVYAIDVDAPHTFFVEGVLSHNKDRNYWEDLDDPWLFMWDPSKHARTPE